MTTVRADTLSVGDETLDPVSGCICTVLRKLSDGPDLVFDMRGTEGFFTITVLANREMSLRKKNDPFAS